MSARTDCTGETRMMKCGMEATCISYSCANDITVQFTDGTVVSHKSKDSFYKGSINNPNYHKSSCLNEKIKMSNGMYATCIAYRGYDDIDVVFEDGVVVKNRSKTNFLQGHIAHPTFDHRSCKNKTRRMNNGQMAKCIADRGCDDIDIQFDDGTIVRNKRRAAFMVGEIRNPIKANTSFPELVVFDSIKKYFPDAKRSYRPRWLRNPSTGKILELDIWIPSLSVGVEYDGGAWHGEETQRSSIKAELIAQSSKIKTLYTILEDGAISHTSPKHKNYYLHCESTFMDYLLPKLEKILQEILRELGVDNPALDFSRKALDRIREDNNNALIGKRVKMNCGKYATCIKFRNTSDIDIKFDDGSIVRHKQKTAFLAGNISHPSINTKTVKASCLGETRMMKCGMEATCIKYKDSNDIDVRFQDGTVVTNRQKNAFILGTIQNPNIPVDRHKASCLGEKVLMSNGQYAECIGYRDCKDIDIRFSDGTIVKGTNKSSFLRGSVANPKKTVYSCKGETRRMKNGELATCIAYRGTQDIDIRFEDGSIVRHRTKAAFYKGETRKNEDPSCLGQTRTMNCGMDATCIAYRGALDIDVQFADGTVITGKSKDNFLRGRIRNPNVKDSKYIKAKERASCLGVSVMMNCGKKAKCIEYRSAVDIDIMFDDGAVVKHRAKASFLRGEIAYPRN